MILSKGYGYYYFKFSLHLKTFKNKILQGEATQETFKKIQIEHTDMKDTVTKFRNFLGKQKAYFKQLKRL